MSLTGHSAARLPLADSVGDGGGIGMDGVSGRAGAALACPAPRLPSAPNAPNARIPAARPRLAAELDPWLPLFRVMRKQSQARAGSENSPEARIRSLYGKGHLPIRLGTPPATAPLWPGRASSSALHPLELVDGHRFYQIGGRSSAIGIDSVGDVGEDRSEVAWDTLPASWTPFGISY